MRKVVPLETSVASLLSERLPQRLPITNGSIVIPDHSALEVPTLSPKRPRTLGSSPNDTRLPPRPKPSISAQFTERVARGSMKAPWPKLPKR